MNLGTVKVSQSQKDDKEVQQQEPKIILDDERGIFKVIYNIHKDEPEKKETSK